MDLAEPAAAIAPTALTPAPAALTIAALRTELGLTLQELGERIELSKSQMHEVEQSNRASVRVAVAIEELSGGRIDAAGLNEDVRLSRHGALDTPDPAPVSRGKGGELSLPPLAGAHAERGVVA